MQIGGRDVWVHTPAMPPPPEGFAVLVLLDGEVWAERLDFGRTLDALAATGLTPPLLTAMVATGGERHTDYACSDTYTAFLTKELLPYIGQRFPITEAPEKTVIAGQSFGGLCAAYVAFSVPERFGAALVQSGSFWWGPDGEDSEWLTHQLAGDPGARFHLQVGVQEWMLSGPVERFREALDKHSCSYTHTEYNGGHDYAVWRAGLPIGLVDLLR
jgi:enterochelin esterase family protein